MNYKKLEKKPKKEMCYHLDNTIAKVLVKTHFTWQLSFTDHLSTYISQLVISCTLILCVKAH